MIEEWGFIRVFVANVAIMMMITYLVNIVHKYMLYRKSRVWKQPLFVVSCVLAGWVSMLFGMHIGEHILIDLRFIPLIVAPMLISSPLPIALIAAGIGAGRFMYGLTASAWAGFTISLLMAIAAILLNAVLRRTSWGPFRRTAMLNLLLNGVHVISSAALGVVPFREYMHHIAPLMFSVSVVLGAVFVFIVRDFQQDFSRRASLVEEANRDHLTKLYNMRAFERYYHKLMELAAGGGRQVSLAFIDIDYFKKINDTYGHAVGDAVLRKAAETFYSSIRWSDFVARYGGEEFVVVLPDTSAEEALEIMERLRLQAAGQQVKTPRGTLSITVSIGISTFPDTSYEDLVVSADRALYQAKASGRNRCFHIQNGETAFEFYRANDYTNV